MESALLWNKTFLWNKAFLGNQAFLWNKAGPPMVKNIQLAVRVESAFLWNIADRVEYSGQGEEQAFLEGTSRLFHAVRLKRDLTEGRCVTIARYV